MTCKVCSSTETIFVTNFKPYSDKPWAFDIFDCEVCGTRFAERDETIPYHEEIHASQNGTYLSHEILAENVKKFIQLGNIDACEQFIRRWSPLYAALIDRIYDLNKTSKLKAVLEVGCSTGFLTAFLRARGFDIHGTDISPSAIHKSKERFGDLYSVDTSENNFDLIIHTGVISCVDDPKSFLDLYLGKLSTNGHMLFNASNINSVNTLGDTWARTPPPDVIFLFGKKAFEYLIDKNSFEYQIINLKDYLNIFKKNILLLKGRTFNCFPKRFFQPAARGGEKKIPVLKRGGILLVKVFTKILCSIGLMKIIDEEFGSLVIVKKTNA